MEDKPVTYGGWSPKNTEGGNMGSMTLRTALALSVNTIAVQLADEVGARNIISTAKKMGISTLVEKGSPNDDNLAIALGGLTRGVIPLEMASAYGTFANKGVHVKPVAITKILDRNGNVIEDESTAKPEETRVMSEREAYEMTTMLQAVIESGTGTGAAIGRPAAGKTGTTDDNKDAWFVGYTPTIVTAVWIGDDTGAHSLGEVYGGTIPAQIWRDYMTKATEDESSADFDVPSGMRRPSRAVETPRKETVEEKKPSTTEKKKKDEATSDSDSKDSAESARKEQAAKNNKEE